MINRHQPYGEIITNSLGGADGSAYREFFEGFIQYKLQQERDQKIETILKK